jgi:ankyrin repeat protein
MKGTIGCAVLALAGALYAQDAGTPFYQAIRSNDLAAVEGLIQKSGVDVRDRRGTTPLMYAGAVGSLDAMKLLVDAGADVNAKNTFDATALMWAAGHIEKVRLLLAKGADVKARSKLGRTPLMLAAFHDGGSEIVRLMIEKGADVSARDKDGISVIEAAATVNDAETVRLLLAKAADANSKDAAGLTPLIQAASNGNRNAEVVRLLLEHGADVNAVSVDVLDTAKNGPLALGYFTPLLFAAPFGNFETVELLVGAGANVNAKDVRGMTPLELALATDRPDPRIIRLLLAKGADPNIKTKSGETAWDWANKYRNPEMQEALGAPRKEQAAATARWLPARYRSVDVKSTVEKAVALIQRTNGNFLDTGGCISCHGQNITGLAVAAARAHGAKVDLARESEQAHMVASMRGARDQLFLQLSDPPEGTDGMEYSLLQIAVAGIPPGPAIDAVVFHVVAMQRKEGDWPNYGPIRPPLEDGSFDHTAMGIRMLDLYFMPGRKAEFEDRIARAAAWLENASPRTTADRAMQLLGIHWAKRTPPEQRVQELMALQRSDGGWGQTPDLPTDAYATGQALYALNEVGMAVTDGAWQRGAEYLRRTQAGDGSWHVKTRAAGFQPYFQSGFPYEHDQWISSAGTAWAAMALAAAIPTETHTASFR